MPDDIFTSPTAAPTRMVTVVEHPAPTYSTNLEPFLNAGCISTEGRPEAMECAATTELGKLGCTNLVVNPALSSLSSRAAAWCGEYKYGGPIILFFRSALALVDGQQVQVVPQEQVGQLFAPLDTAERALAYAIGMSESRPVNDLKTPFMTEMPGVVEVHETHARADGDGFVVNLFDETQENNVSSPACAAYQIELQIHVQRDGAISADTPRYLRKIGGCVVY